MIHKAASNFVWDNVSYYDITFRQLMSQKLWRSWSKTYSQAWNLAMVEPLNRSGSGKSTHESSSLGGPVKYHDWRDDCCWKTFLLGPFHVSFHSFHNLSIYMKWPQNQVMHHNSPVVSQEPHSVTPFILLTSQLRANINNCFNFAQSATGLINVTQIKLNCPWINTDRDSSLTTTAENFDIISEWPSFELFVVSTKMTDLTILAMFTYGLML